MNKTSIILTRPRLQNAGLQAELAKLGFPTLVFPLLEIEEIKARAISNNCDGVIFTSPNAVKFYQAEIAIPTFAVGPGTQAALAKKNTSAKMPAEFNSEGLLALPELQNVAGRKIAIVTGENPRPLLAKTLRQRGADVEIIFCYRRLRPRYSSAEIEKIVAERNSWIIVSSAESLANLVEIFADHVVWLYQRQLVVTSPSLSVQAQQLGFSLKSLVAMNASDEALIDVLASRSPD